MTEAATSEAASDAAMTEAATTEAAPSGAMSVAVDDAAMTEAATGAAAADALTDAASVRAVGVDAEVGDSGGEGEVRSRRGVSRRDGILDAARNSFAKRGYEASSLDSIAADCGVRKQTVLYHFGSKESLLEAVIDRTLEEVSAALLAVVDGTGAGETGTRGQGSAVEGPGVEGPGVTGAGGTTRPSVMGSEGWDVIRSVVKEVFRIAVRRPELLGLLREVTRLGNPWTARVRLSFEPLEARAVGFLEAEAEAGRIRCGDPRLILVSAYSKIMGTATEVEVQRALGVEPTLRETARRRRELLDFLRSSLVG